MNKKIKTLKKSVVERQISDDIKLEEEKDKRKSIGNSMDFFILL